MTALRPLIASGLALYVLTGSIHAATMRIVADNDFAVYVGTAAGITQQVYNNNFVWGTQAGQPAFNVTLGVGETHIYILAMGGGGAENMAGVVNGIDITTIAGIQKSANIQPALVTGGYTQTRVEAGMFDPDSFEVAGAVSTTSWTTPTGGDIAKSGVSLNTFSGYSAFQIPTFNAVVYRFSGASVGEVLAAPLSAVPEPASALAMGGLLGSVLLLRRRERRDG